jgi:hypothetical protein
MNTDETKDTPKKRRAESKREKFLAALRNSANVRAACQAAGLPRISVYRWRNNDAAFAAKWEEALDEAVDTLEAAAWQRGRDGVLKPVYQGGEKVGDIREYSDTLLIFLLKANRPGRYRETIRNEHTGELTVNWRDEAQKNGIDANKAEATYQKLVASAVAELSGAGGNKGGSGENQGEANTSNANPNYRSLIAQIAP